MTTTISASAIEVALCILYADNVTQPPRPKNFTDIPDISPSTQNLTHNHPTQPAPPRPAPRTSPHTMSLPTRLTRSLLHHPAPLRPLLVSAPRHTQHAAPYHSYETQPPAPYPAAETAILSAALSHVPAHGFTHAALALGARDVGYLDATASNLFPRGPFEIVLFHRVGQRLGLGQRVQFAEGEKMGVGAKVRTLVRERLRGNEEVAGRMTEVSRVDVAVRLTG